jgi:2-polyprenyl-6-methoxyphenol hydroxylase-like FAD-dependent oxidoreductase
MIEPWQQHSGRLRMNDHYDAIVVGARCAGATTAMLLARQGYRVLVVDRAKFPSDTLSTHVIHAPGVAALDRWGLLDAVVATGCPPIEHYSFDFGPVVIDGTTHPVDGHTTAYAPRRTVLDTILVKAAADAGASVREEFNVDDLIVSDDQVCGIRGHVKQGDRESLTARIVIGADGRAVRSPRRSEPPPTMRRRDCSGPSIHTFVIFRSMASKPTSGRSVLSLPHPPTTA